MERPLHLFELDEEGWHLVGQISPGRLRDWGELRISTAISAAAAWPRVPLRPTWLGLGLGVGVGVGVGVGLG